MDTKGDVYKNLKNVCEKKKLPQIAGRIKVKQFKSLDKIKESQVIYMVSEELESLSKLQARFPKSVIITENLTLFEQGSHINLEIRENHWYYRHHNQRLLDLGLKTNNIFEKQSLNNVKEDETQQAFDKYRQATKTEIQTLMQKIKDLEDFKNTTDWVQKDVLDLLKSVTSSLDIEEVVKDSLLELLDEKRDIIEVRNDLRKVTSDKKDVDEKVKEAHTIIRNTKRQVKNQQVIIWIILTVLLSLVAVAFYIDSSRKKKHLQEMTQAKDEIQEKNENLKKI